MFIAGTSFKNWIQLLWKNKFKVSNKNILTVIFISITTLLLAPLRLYEYLKYRKKIRKTKLEKPPIFIVGHWRSGTTHLQNLLAQDKRFGYLTYAEGTFPHIFLSSYKFTKKIMKKALPSKRPSDNVKLDPDKPIEHDWSISNLCLLSPYSGVYFPNTGEMFYEKYGTFEKANKREKRKWKKTFKYLLKKLTIKKNGKQLVLKSPPDTFRVKLIHDLFPDAKFIHIYRNPYHVFFSTKKLHTKNTDLYMLQEPERDVDKFVYELYKKMYEKFYEDIEEIPDKNIIEISYEELIHKPIESLENIYSSLSLPDIEEVKKEIKQYLNSIADYQSSKYDISKEKKKEIYSQWHHTIDRWGYEKP